MEIMDLAKNTAAVLGTVTTIAYGSGYLALRARAHALGTDPAFTLVDEGYVFAGFRFLFVTLLCLLLLIPVIIIVRMVASWLLNLQFVDKHIHSIQWLGLVLLAIAAIVTFKVFSAKGLLLQQSDANALQAALYEVISGGQPAMSLLLTLSAVLLATLSILWLQKVYLSGGNSLLACVLGIVVSIQIFMLPVFHGVLLADRNVRVLAGCPDSVKGIMAPMGIVDRTIKHVTILGRDAFGKNRLVTVKLDDLNGIPIRKIVHMHTFLKNDLNQVPRHHDVIFEVSGESHKVQQYEEESMTPETTSIKKNFFTTLIEYIQVTFESIGSLGDRAVEAGQLWSVDISPEFIPSEPRQIGAFDHLAWPVMGPDDSTIYALQQMKVVRIEGGGQTVAVVNSKSNWI